MANIDLSPAVLWQPGKNADHSDKPVIRFMQYLEERLAREHEAPKFGGSYWKLYKWSCRHFEAFWFCFFQFSKIKTSHPHAQVVSSSIIESIPRWFIGSRLNYAENLLRYSEPSSDLIDRVAVYFAGERTGGSVEKLTWRALRAEVTRYAAALRAIGVQEGDRVAAYMPNCCECLIACLATASIGAVWSSCSPDFGVTGVLDRFEQVEPKVLFTVDSVIYNAKQHDTLSKVESIVRSLPSVQRVVVVPFGSGESDIQLNNTTMTHLSDFLQEGASAASAELQFEQVSFDHPLFIMFSSGTTGRPKCLVHSVGGTLLKHLAEHSLQSDLTEGDCLMFYTTVGWMMWNWLISALALGSSIVLYDGSPVMPSPTVLWDVCDAADVSVVGMGAAVYGIMEQRSVQPMRTHKLTRLRAVLSTGSPLKPTSFDYIYKSIKDDVVVGSISGGTDIIGCFMGNSSLVPVHRGECQVPFLGCQIESWTVADSVSTKCEDPGKGLLKGNRIFGERGELVCVKPFPSMPTHFLNDDAQNSKYKKAYFSKYAGVWSHGDYCVINPNTGGIVMLGRSDATLNPAGVRFGSAEIYHVVESLPFVADSICVSYSPKENDVDDGPKTPPSAASSDERCVLFVKLTPDAPAFDRDVEWSIRKEIRTHISARHVPQCIVPVGDIPYTGSGKKVEIAVKHTLMNEPVRNLSALANPDCLQAYRDLIPRLDDCCAGHVHMAAATNGQQTVEKDAHAMVLRSECTGDCEGMSAEEHIRHHAAPSSSSTRTTTTTTTTSRSRTSLPSTQPHSHNVITRRSTAAGSGMWTDEFVNGSRRTDYTYAASPTYRTKRYSPTVEPPRMARRALHGIMHYVASSIKSNSLLSWLWGGDSSSDNSATQSRASTQTSARESRQSRAQSRREQEAFSDEEEELIESLRPSLKRRATETVTVASTRAAEMIYSLINMIGFIVLMPLSPLSNFYTWVKHRTTAPATPYNLRSRSRQSTASGASPQQQGRKTRKTKGSAALPCLCLLFVLLLLIPLLAYFLRDQRSREKYILLVSDGVEYARQSLPEPGKAIGAFSSRVSDLSHSAYSSLPALPPVTVLTDPAARGWVAAKDGGWRVVELVGAGAGRVYQIVGTGTSTALSAILLALKSAERQPVVTREEKRPPIDDSRFESLLQRIIKLEDAMEDLRNQQETQGDRETPDYKKSIEVLALNIQEMKIQADREAEGHTNKIVALQSEVRNAIDATATLSSTVAQVNQLSLDELKALPVLVKQLENRMNELETQLVMIGERGATSQLDTETSAKFNAEIASLQSSIAFLSKNAAAESTSKSADAVDLTAVRKLFYELLAIYDSDKTGRADYALEPSGGSIVSTRCSQTFEPNTRQESIFGLPFWFLSYSPRTVIQHGVVPGECWAFQGHSGVLVIKLAARILPDSFTYEHIPASLSTTTAVASGSAPREISVFGLGSAVDNNPQFLANYTYTADGAALQSFPVTNSAARSTQFIELRVNTNHGNPVYTCLYRFRVHGTPRA